MRASGIPTIFRGGAIWSVCLLVGVAVHAPYPFDPCRYGNAIADLIYGDAIPQAKLPLTFPKVNNEQKMTQEQWPGIPSKQFPGNLQVTYVPIHPT